MKNFSFSFLFICLIFIQNSFAEIDSSNNASDDLEDIIIYKNSGQKIWGEELTSIFFEKLSPPSLESLFTIPIASEDLELLGCSNFNTLTDDQKKAFYIVFFAAIAERESDFKADDETFDRGHFNTNIGLFQIDKNSAIRHAFKIVGKNVSKKDLKNPITNFMVGTYILKNQLEGNYREDTTGRLFPDKHFYWEVLGQRKREKFLKSFNNNRMNLPFCEDSL